MRFYSLHPLMGFQWLCMYGNLQFPGQHLASSSFLTIQLRYPYLVHAKVLCFVTFPLKSTNFLIWETQIVNLIESQGYIGFIDGYVPAPSPTLLVQMPDSSEQLMPNPYFVAWARTDRLIKGWIMGTLSEVILCQVVGLHTTIEVWKELKKKFADATMCRELALHHHLHLLSRMNCDSLDEYLSKYKTICDELRKWET